MKHIRLITAPSKATDWWAIINIMNPIISVIVMLGEFLNIALANKVQN